MTDQAPNVTLKPCPNPWCEAAERDGDFSPQIHYSNFELVFVACTSCGMAGPTRQHEAEAITAWNQRASTGDDTGALREALKSARGWVITCSSSAQARRDLKRIDAALDAAYSGGFSPFSDDSVRTVGVDAEWDDYDALASDIVSFSVEETYV